MPSMDKRKLQSNYFMIVNDITFASDEIGAATGGREAETSWAQGETLIFHGQLRHHLIFGLMAFDVNPASLTSPEKFSLIPERSFKQNGVQVININPGDSTEGIVLPEDVAFLELITENYRKAWDESVGLIVEAIADATDKTIYYGSRLAALAYGLQYNDTPALVRTVYDFGIFDRNYLGNYSDTIDLVGTSGPVEVSRAHISIGNLILAA